MGTRQNERSLIRHIFLRKGDHDPGEKIQRNTGWRIPCRYC